MSKNNSFSDLVIVLIIRLLSCVNKKNSPPFPPSALPAFLMAVAFFNKSREANISTGNYSDFNRF